MRQISQSLVKEIIDRHGYLTDNCPEYINQVRLLGNFQQESTKAMHLGNYGEYLILGATRDGDKPIEPITHKKTGEKILDILRIEEQCGVGVPNMMAKYMINVIKGQNVQVPVWKMFDKDGVQALVCAHLDIFPTTIMWDKQLRTAIIDVKFTGDVNNTFGDFSWGAPYKMDHFQADVYQWIIRDFDYALNKKMEPEFEKRVGYHNIFTQPVLEMIKRDEVIFVYFIIGYSKTENQIKLLQRLRQEETMDRDGVLTVSNIREQEALERLRKGIVQLDEWDENGFPINPSFENCTNCPLSFVNGGECTGYSHLNKI